MAAHTRTMASGLTELGLNVREAAGTSHADQLARFLAGVIEVVAEFAPPAEDVDRHRFRRELEGYRAIALDASRRHELERAARSCVADCTAYFQTARTYSAERERELTELVSILRDAARLSLGQSADFHAQVIASSQRVESIAQLDDIRDLRRRLGEEVVGLRRAVAEKQKREDEAFRALTTRVETLQTRLAELEVQVTVDPLTRIANRGSFDRALVQQIAAARRTGAPLAFAMVDVDHFKQINDTHGHQVGDRVLLCLAQKLANAVRPGDVVARYGGEEFGVLLAASTATEVEGQLRALLSDIAASTFAYDVLGQEQRVRFTVSCGLTDLQPSDSESDLVARADEALYEAKRKGRNRLVTRRPSLLGRMLRTQG